MSRIASARRPFAFIPLPLSLGALLFACASAGVRAEPPGIMLGAFIPPSWDYEKDILSFDEAAGKTHTHTMIFCKFDYEFWDGPYLLRRMGEAGKSPIICWQSGIDGISDPSFSNASFLAGAHDAGIVAMARGVGRFVREFDLPVYIRWAHEANIGSAPAWPGHQYNHESPAEYIAMFRYVHDLFYAQLTSEEGEKVVWTWSVNYLGSAKGLDTYSDWRNLYPGDAYVDMTGLSGLNYGDHPTAGPGFPVTVQWLYLPILRSMMAGDYRGGARTPATARELAAMSGGKPQGIFEFGSVDSDGAGTRSTFPKTDWIRQGYDALARMDEFSFVRLVTWYNDIADSGGLPSDFRVSVNPHRQGEEPVPERVTRAYREAVSDPRYVDRILTPAELDPGGFRTPASMPQPRRFPQHEFWPSVRPGGSLAGGDSLAAAYFLYLPSEGGGDECDIYIAVRIPTGGWFAFMPPGRWIPFDPAKAPPPATVRGMRVIREVRGTAFVMTLPSTLPEGTYTFYSILTPPGADPRNGGPDLKTSWFTLAPR